MSLIYLLLFCKEIIKVKLIAIAFKRKRATTIAITIVERAITIKPIIKMKKSKEIIPKIKQERAIILQGVIDKIPILL